MKGTTGKNKTEIMKCGDFCLSNNKIEILLDQKWSNIISWSFKTYYLKKTTIQIQSTANNTMHMQHIAKQSNAMQSNTKQCNAKQNIANQCKHMQQDAKTRKTKQCNTQWNNATQHTHIFGACSVQQICWRS